MADDHDALLARADGWYGRLGEGITGQLIDDLAAALRESQANYHAALDNLAMVIEGFEPAPTGTHWHRDPILADDNERTIEEMTDRHWRVFCHAAQRATRGGT
jgi:hypothetical protein